MSGPDSDGSNKRRRSSPSSYSSRVRAGSAPAAHTAAYEAELQRYGIVFDELPSEGMLTRESRGMCTALLDSNELPPAYNSCSAETFLKMFTRATKCNEERVRRDLTPHIVPSAELLYVLNGDTALENVREEMSGDWTQCAPLGGTRPRPDYAYGLSSATFTEEECAKLKDYTNSNNPTKFTDSMYFPFLVCEAKCGKKNINDADRQNAHSASIAVHAILQLFRTAGEEHARSLSGHILVISVSHDNERVNIYGHFAVLRDGATSFHRYRLDDYILDYHQGRHRNRASNFTRAVYRDFYPMRLERIQRAVARLPDAPTTSISPGFSTSEGDSQAGEQPSQATDISSGPPLSRVKSRESQGDLTWMKQHMAVTEQMYKTQLEQQQKQMEQQKEESRKQMEQQREEHREQMALLRQLVDRMGSR